MPTLQNDTATAAGPTVEIAAFRRAAQNQSNGLEQIAREWSDGDWENLFRFTTTRSIGAGQALIRATETDRTLYFVLGGSLEVFVHSGDGVSLGAISRDGAGSVFGELSFFDGQGRSASVWSVQPSQIAAMAPDQYLAFKAAHPGLALDLIFALGRLLATRLRTTNSRLST